jgi:hypothetical protein
VNFSLTPIQATIGIVGGVLICLTAGYFIGRFIRKGQLVESVLKDLGDNELVKMYHKAAANAKAVHDAQVAKAAAEKVKAAQNSAAVKNAAQAAADQTIHIQEVIPEDQIFAEATAAQASEVLNMETSAMKPLHQVPSGN